MAVLDAAERFQRNRTWSLCVHFVVILFAFFLKNSGYQFLFVCRVHRKKKNHEETNMCAQTKKLHVKFVPPKKKLKKKFMNIDD